MATKTSKSSGKKSAGATAGAKKAGKKTSGKKTSGAKKAAAKTKAAAKKAAGKAGTGKPAAKQSGGAKSAGAKSATKKSGGRKTGSAKGTKKAPPSSKAGPKGASSASKATGKAGKKPASRARKTSARVKELVGDALSLDDDKTLLKAYYAGNQMPSPNGGFLMPLGVRAGEDGSALLFLECSASSLRYWLEIPRATRTERKKVKDVLDEGGDPDCPRHGHGQRLVRVGRDLVCTLCGVAYAKT